MAISPVTQRCVARDGLQPESVGGLIFDPQPCGLANLQGPQLMSAFACRPQSGEANQRVGCDSKARAR